MPQEPVRVLVADSQKLFSGALATTLETAGGFKVLEQRPATGLDTIKLLADQAAVCDLVILDYWIARMPGPATTRAIRKLPAPPSVVLTGWFHTPVEVKEASQAGAAAFVSKSAGFAELLEVIRRALAGESFLYRGEGAKGVEALTLAPPAGNADEVWSRLMTLTVREIEVLSLLSYAPVEKVAKNLSISLGTLRNHISNILRKTEARSQIEAIDIARRVGLIDS